MGSLRNPIGPLPSSIYWRRRAVLLSVVAVLALLIAWIVTSGGGGGKNGADGSNGKNPASTITPGPSGSGPAISQHPGGRDESSGGGSGGSGDDQGSGAGDDGNDGDGSGSAGGGDSTESGGGSADGGGSGGTGVGGPGAGATLPASSSLPNCVPGSVSLSLRSKHNSYSPDQTPEFVLTAKNTSGTDCKIDLGPKHTVLTINQADGSDAYWASDDCPKSAPSQVYRVPANSSVTYTVDWDRRPSAPRCATPPAGSAGAGTYLVEARAAGFGKVRTSFVLAAD